MEVKKHILAIFRVLEAIPTMNHTYQRTVIERANKALSDEDRKVMANVAMAMVLLTAGNQETLRNPQKYTKPDPNQTFSKLTNTHFRQIIQKLGLPFNLDNVPRKENYELAHKLLPYIGSSTVSKADIEPYKDVPGGVDIYGAQGHDEVYRGLSDVSKDVHLFLLTNPTWDMKRGVSTSTEMWESRKFARATDPFGSGDGPAVLFTISNLSKRGFNAGRLSRYSDEHEVILSGEIKVDSWVYEASGILTTSAGEMGEARVTIIQEQRKAVITNTYGQKLSTMFFDDSSGIFGFFKQSVEEFAHKAISTENFEFPWKRAEKNQTWEFQIHPKSSILKVNATLP